MRLPRSVTNCHTATGDFFRREWQPLQIFENNRRDSTGAKTTTPRTPCQQCVGMGSLTSHNRAVRRDLRFALISVHRRSRNTTKIYCVIQWIVIYELDRAIQIGPDGYWKK